MLYERARILMNAQWYDLLPSRPVDASQCWVSWETRSSRLNKFGPECSQRWFVHAEHVVELCSVSVMYDLE